MDKSPPNEYRVCSPCKDCAEKYPACHDACPKDRRGEYGYSKWKEEREAVKLNKIEYQKRIGKDKWDRRY